MLYINITFDQNDGKGERTFTLAMKPKPWTTAEGAWFVEHEINAKNESDVVRDPLSIKNTKVNDIAPLSPYRVYGGVIKGLEETSSVAIINRASGLKDPVVTRIYPPEMVPLSLTRIDLKFSLFQSVPFLLRISVLLCAFVGALL